MDRKKWSAAFLALLVLSSASPGRAAEPIPIHIKVSVADQPTIESDEPIKIAFTRTLAPNERIAVFLGSTDLSDLFELKNSGKGADRVLTYDSYLMPLPPGESELVVSIVRGDEWEELARYPVKVIQAGTFETATIKPVFDVNIKAQHFDNRYPDPTSTPPRRERYADVDARFHLESQHSKPKYAANTEWDVQGFNRREDALLFSQKGDHASRVDLSGYRVNLRFYKNELSLGNVNFGENRLLMDGFGSRGVALRIPLLGDRLDFGLAVLNGQSIVGADNFFGLSRRVNQVRAARAGWTVLQRHGRLRVDFTAMDGSMLPLAPLNQALLTDAEKSKGWAVKVAGSDPWNRLDIEAGLARSRFTNPADPLLSQDQTLVEVKEVQKSAHYADVKLKVIDALSLSYRHQRNDPQYKSVAVSMRPDFLEHRYGAGGEARGVSYQANIARSWDNLDNIRSVMKNETRSWSFQGGVKLATLLGATRRTSWYPSLNYTYDFNHQLGLYVPENISPFGEATQENVPDLVTRNHTAGTEWQFDRASLGVSYSVNSTDNQQLGREDADFTNTTRSLKAGLKPFKTLNLGFDLGLSRNFSAAANTLSRTTNFGTNADWSPFEKTSVSGTWSLTRENDSPLTRETTSTTASVRVSQRFSVTKRCTGQAFLSYNQSLSKSTDKDTDVVTHVNRWVLNSGISLSLF